MPSPGYFGEFTGKVLRQIHQNLLIADIDLRFALIEPIEMARIKA